MSSAALIADNIHALDNPVQNAIIAGAMIGFVLPFFILWIGFKFADAARKGGRIFETIGGILVLASFLPGYIVGALYWGEPICFGALVGAVCYTIPMLNEIFG